MKLSRVERLILSNQFKILAKLEPKDAKYLERKIEALESGYERQYASLFEYVYEDTMTDDECKEVTDTLQLHRIMTFSYRDMQDKPGIDARSIEFPGFDGNNETKQLGYVQYICAPDQRMFEELQRGDDYNSHSPMLHRYRTMLGRWNRMDRATPLTKDQILAIVAR